MSPETAYQKFIVKINKNAQTNNISCDRGRFVLIYNESQNKEVEYILEKRNEDDIRYVQKLLVSSPIKPKEEKESYTTFELPSNFFDHSTLTGTATKDCCEKQVLDMYEIKSENENMVMFDNHNRPSFEWREAPYYFTDNKVKAFRSDFKYDNLNLTYYRYPVQISLQDEDNPESHFTSQQIELDDKITDRIISRAASEFELNNNNPKYQADLQRSQLK